MGAAAAIILRKEKEIVAAFRRARATTPTTAVSPSDVGVEQRVPFRLLRRRDILREAQAGRFYLDEPRWEALRRMRHRLAFVLGLTLLIAAAVIAFIGGTHAVR